MRQGRSIFRAVVALALFGAGIGGSAAVAQLPAPPGIDFKAEGIPGFDTIYLKGIGSEDPDGLLRIEVWAEDVTDLYGLSFALRFPKHLLRFPRSREEEFREGTLLSADGTQDTVLLVRQNDNEIIVGLTRMGEAAGVSGSGHLLTLEFRGQGVAGKRLLDLHRTRAFDATGAEIGHVSWLAGKVVVTVAE